MKSPYHQLDDSSYIGTLFFYGYYQYSSRKTKKESPFIRYVAILTIGFVFKIIQ